MLVAAIIISSLHVASAEPRARVLVLDVRTEGDPQLAAVLSNEVATVLARGGVLEVLSTEDLRRLADVAATREATGCDDSGACLAEIGAAMGARYVVSGTLGTVGSATLVQLSLFDVDRGRSIARESGEAAGADGVVATTRAVSERLRAALVPEEPVHVPVVPLAVAGGGGALALGGVAVAAIAYPVVVDTTLPSAGGPDPQWRQSAQVIGAVAVVAAGAGVVTAGVGATLYLLGVGE